MIDAPIDLQVSGELGDAGTAEIQIAANLQPLGESPDSAISEIEVSFVIFPDVHH